MNKISRYLGRLEKLLPFNSVTPYFGTSNVKIGKNVTFGDNVVFNCDKVRIGDGCTIMDDVRVDADEFIMGDYGTIYPDSYFTGSGKLQIGHNFWLGKGAIIDSIGGTTIGNNVGIGAQSQLWSHAKFGDEMVGNQFTSKQKLEIGNDVWFVGHCLVSPITAGDRSIAMLGSVVTNDMKADHTYAGTPAKDVTDKLGKQFKDTKAEDRVEYMQNKLMSFAQKRSNKNLLNKFKIVRSSNEMKTDKNVTYFNVMDRTYTKRGTKLEHDMMRYLLPDAKFTPLNESKRMSEIS